MKQENSLKENFRKSTFDFIGSSDHEEGTDSEQENQKLNQKKLEKQAEKFKKKINQRDFLVNAGFSFDITDYFKFQNKEDELRQQTFFKHLSQQHYLSWVVLLYSVVSSAMIPPWLMSIGANKLLRISWRCLLQLVILMPFVLLQRRSANQATLQKYSLSHIFNPKHIKKIFIGAFAGAFYVSTILTTIEWTYISHSMVLGSLTNFFLSIQRTFKATNGQLEKGGQILIILGIFMVFYDSATLDTSQATEVQWNVYNYFYLTREWWQRILGDIGAICVAYTMSQLSKQTSDLKEYYPPYLSMFLINVFTCIFVIFSAFFFNGTTFDFNTSWGVFALFTHNHFSNFLYMSIVLGMGVFISFVMVSKMFPDPIVPALAMTLQPIISTILFQVVGVQTMPGSYACMGYAFVIPGVIVILVGNCLFTRKKPREDKMMELLDLKKKLKFKSKHSLQKIEEET